MLSDRCARLGDIAARRDDGSHAQSPTIAEISRILQYLSIPMPENIPRSENLGEQIDFVLQPSGAFSREVSLTGDWWKQSDGPLLAVLKADGSAVALLPGPLGGYTCRYGKRKIRISKASCTLFEERAWCFYRPLPAAPVSAGGYIRFLLSSLRPGDYVMFLASCLFLSLFGLIIPAATSYGFGNVVPTGAKEMLLPLGVLLLSVSLGRWLMNIVRSSSVSRIRARLTTASDNAVYARVISLPASFFSGKSTGEIAQKISSLQALPLLLGEDVIGSSLGTVLISLFYLLELFYIAPAVALPVFVTYGTELLVLIITISLESRYVRERMKGEEKSSGRVFGILTGIQKIRVSGSEKRALAKWMDSYAERMRPLNAIWTLEACLTPVLTAVSLLGTAWIYAIAFRKGLTVGQFAGFSAAFGMALSGLFVLGACSRSVARIGPILERASPILTAVPEASENKKSIRSVSGQIEVSNVSFSYDPQDKKILNNLSLKIEPGEYVAITGESGCGKSTLLRLLLGFETPQQGHIYYDRTDLESISRRSLRQHIGTVLQDGRLFAGDIYSNITIGAPWLGLDDAWEAAEKAGIAEEIRSMPMGMNTFVTERGGGISGGQRQRLLIARAICAKPSVLLLDEATSALDNISQKIVTDTLAGMNCTRIVIAHRLSTLKACDRIVVLHHGSICEEGTYEELMAKDGLFATLARRQLE